MCARFFMITIMIPAPFDQLPDTALRRFDFPAGTRLFTEGAPARALFAIEHGVVHMLRTTVEGQQVVIARAGAGETLAEAALFTDCYHCDAVIREDVTGWRIDRRAVSKALSQGGGFATAICARLAGQVRKERLRCEIMSIRAAEERVFAALVGFGQNGTVTAFAAEIGLSQEACARALTRLVTAGRVEKIARGRYAAR